MESITLYGTQAINLSDIPGSTNAIAQSVTLPQGQYRVSLQSTVKFSGESMPLNQVVLFNTAPMTTGDSDKWYLVVDTTQKIPATIYAAQNNPIYVLILDQVNANDNTGSLTVTFTPV